MKDVVKKLHFKEGDGRRKSKRKSKRKKNLKEDQREKLDSLTQRVIYFS